MPDVHWYAKRRAGSRLQIDSGGVFDWDSGDVTLTHSANTLTLAGGVLALPDGSAAAPSLARAGATNANSGIYFTGAATNTVMNFSTEGAQQATLSSPSLLTVTTLRLDLSNGDVRLARAAAATLYLYGSSTAVGATQRLGNTNVGYEDLARNSEAHTLAAAGTSTTATAVWPANSSSLGAAFRITTEITGCTSVQVGVAGATTRYGTFSTLTAGQTIAIGRVDNYAAETGVLFTAVGGGASFTAGVVRVNLRYITASAPTS